MSGNTFSCVSETTLSTAIVNVAMQDRPCGTHVINAEGHCSPLQVAEICVDALSEPAASNKVVEIIADQTEVVRPAAELFANVQ